jgi:hypothetical protein
MIALMIANMPYANTFMRSVKLFLLEQKPDQGGQNICQKNKYPMLWG